MICFDHGNGLLGFHKGDCQLLMEVKSTE